MNVKNHDRRFVAALGILTLLGGPLHAEDEVVPCVPDRQEISLSVGKFGPWKMKIDSRTHVGIVTFASKMHPESEGIHFNFYLAGYWSTNSVTAEGIARLIRGRPSPGTEIVNSFAAPEQPGGELAYYILSVFTDGKKLGQINLIKVAKLAKAAYSRIYSRTFVTDSTSFKEESLKWILGHSQIYTSELSRIAVDQTWISVIEQEISKAK